MTDEVYVVIGTSGEYSDREVWVAGAYTDKPAAVKVAEELKARDRSEIVAARAWWKEFRDRGGMETRGEDYRVVAARFGMPLQPPYGSDDSEYTVACVPLNTLGKWSWSE